MSSSAPVIGIDLGTTNSVVATVQHGQAIVIPNRAGQPLTPSVVALARGEKRLVGAIAKRQAITNPEATVHGAKRLIGRKFSSPQVQQSLERLPYPLHAGSHDDVRVQLGTWDATLPELSAQVLASLKADAEAFLGQPVTRAVITVPAHFNDGQRQATKDAGAIAGLEVLRILNEPTAAAIAYGHGRAMQGRILVFDLGGGTFDVSVLELDGGVYEVRATGGDTFLGGEDLDERIIDWLVTSFAREHGVNLRKDRMALQRLRDAAEKAKLELSFAQETEVTLPFLYTPGAGGTALHLQRTLTRGELEALTGDLVARTLEVADGVLADARLRPRDIQEIVLVGGQTRMPLLQAQVRAHFGREPSRGVHPEEVVAIGAALHAHALTSGRADVTLLDVTSLSLGLAVAGGFVRQLIPRNTAVPTATTETFTTSRDGQETVKIMVLQGEAQEAARNELLGEFSLTGLRKGRRGEVKVDVTFEIDSEGIVRVSAVDQETGASQGLTVAASGGLTPGELEALIAREAGKGAGDSLPQVVPPRDVRASLHAALQEAARLLPQLRTLTGRVSASGSLGRSEALLEAARGALGSDDSGELTRSLEQVQALVTSLRSMLDEAGAR